MSTIGAFLTAAAGPLAKRVMTALGVGVVTYVGLDLAVGGLLAAARDSFNGMPADVMAYLAYARVPTAFAIVAGGITARLTLHSLKSFTLL